MSGELICAQIWQLHEQNSQWQCAHTGMINILVSSASSVSPTWNDVVEIESTYMEKRNDEGDGVVTS